MNIQLPNGKQMTAEEWKTARENVNKSQRPFYPIGSGEKKTAGSTFVKSDAYKRFLENGQSFSDAVPYKKDLGSTSAGGNLLGDSLYLPDIYGGTAAGMPMSIRDLLNVQNTANN